MVSVNRLNFPKSILLVALLVLGFSGAFLAVFPRSSAQTSGDVPFCSPIVALVDPIESTISGNKNFAVQIPTGFPGAIQNVTFYLNNPPAIGSSSVATPDNLWVVPNFNTTTKPNGTYNYHARIHYYDTNTTTSTLLTCKTNARQITINNATSTTSSLALALNTNKWSGPTNNNIKFVAHTGINNGSGTTDVSDSASYQWKTSIGSINFVGRNASFSSGPTAGRGTITVVSSYGGHQKTATIDIEVFNATDSNVATYPTVTATDPANPATSPIAPKNSIQGDAELESCLKVVVGEDTYKNYAASGTRFSFSNISQSDKCFAKRRHVIPASLAPIAPDKIKALPVSEKHAKIESFKTVNVNGKQVITISGIGQPNETVLIYIFSEPLVLVAQADSSGKWSYTLEDPLESGSHEAYVAVEDDKNIPVRSNSYAFGIASATKTDSNPLGLSLLTSKKDPITLYVGGGIGVVAVGGLALYIILRHRRKLQPAGTSPTIANPAQNFGLSPAPLNQPQPVEPIQVAQSSPALDSSPTQHVIAPEQTPPPSDPTPSDQEQQNPNAQG